MPSSSPFRAPAATRLSWLAPRISSQLGRFYGLARLSLVALALSMLSGCLVDDPPPFVAPQQTRPRLDHTRAEPGLDQIIVRNTGELIEFKMPVTSEDAGEPLYATLLFDYGGDGSVPDFLYSVPMPASTLDDDNRVFKLPWTVRKGVAPGCHRFTLRVTHLDNINPDHPEQPIDKTDLAEAFWFANINVTPENANSLVDCPQASAGAD